MNFKNINIYYYEFFCIIILLNANLFGAHQSKQVKISDDSTFDQLIEFIRTDDLIITNLQKLINDNAIDNNIKKEMNLFLTKFDQIQTKISSSEYKCRLCNITSVALKFLSKNMTYPDLEKLIVKGCQVLLEPLGYKVDPICDTVQIQLPSIIYVLNKLIIPNKICPYLNACLPSTTKNVYRKSKKNQKPNTKISSGNDILKVVHITDLHIESNYKQGSNTDCGLPVCCLETYGSGSAGFYGDYNCNIPLKTVELFLESVNQQTPDFVIFSGDIPPHTLWEETYDSQVACTEMLTSVLQQKLPGIPIFPNLGNHEFHPTNLFSMTHLNYTNPFLKDYLRLWTPLSKFDEKESQDILNGGSYSKLVWNGLRLISFNSNYMYTMNFYNVLNDMKNAETANLKKFLIKSLDEAIENNEKVILMSHHPPGNGDYIVSLSRWYEELILNYSQHIVLMPVGHTHYDEFKLIYDSAGKAKSVILVSPSMTTKSTRNPSMRVYHLKADDFQLNDYFHYYLDLKTAIDNGINSSSIRLLYSAKQEYGLKDLSATSWDDLLSRFSTDNTLFSKHLRHSQADAVSDADADCSSRCREMYVCRMKNINYDDYLSCVPPRQIPPPSTPAASAGLPLIGCTWYLFGAILIRNLSQENVVA